MTADSHLVCRRCGFANVPGDQFCGSCGAFLEWEGEPAAEPVPPAVTGGPDPDVPVVRPAGGPPPVAVPPAAGQPYAPTAPTEVTPVFAGSAGAGLLRCPACGIANAAGRTFCQSCGTKLAEAPRVAEPTAAQIAAAVSAPARPVTVQTTSIRPAMGEPKAASGGSIGKWIVLMVVVGLLVGAGAVVASQLLKGTGPASVASSGPSAAATGGAATAGSSGAPSGETPSGEAPSAESPSGEPTVAPTDAPKPEALVLAGAVASSVVGDLEKFQPAKAIDGNPKTCWQEGSKTEKGEWIEVTFAPSRVTSLVITNGYNASKALFKGNKRLKDIAVSINGGAPIKLRLDDTGSPQKLNVKDVAGATTLRITILSTYGAVKTSVSGTPFDDAALGEVVVMGVVGS
ncbi:MAG TPA: hypothetical protein VES19_12310 [Candidatus Limnocylindrales bacterium]|nr:hypothetical protein [Candidatus Limnocylindrales bacterium]